MLSGILFSSRLDTYQVQEWSSISLYYSWRDREGDSPTFILGRQAKSLTCCWPRDLHLAWCYLKVVIRLLFDLCYKDVAVIYISSQVIQIHPLLLALIEQIHSLLWEVQVLAIVNRHWKCWCYPCIGLFGPGQHLWLISGTHLAGMSCIIKVMGVCCCRVARSIM